MKKIFLLLFAAVCAVASWADDVVTAKYSGNKLDVELTNTTTFLAFQMDIDLPDDANVESIVSNLDRLQQGANVQINSVDTPTPFVLAHNMIDPANKVLRVVAYNLGNHEIVGNAGKLFTVNLDKTVSEASISNILFVDQALVEKGLANAVAQPGGVVGDLDDSGTVTMADVAIALNMYLGLAPVELAADIDGSGDVTMADVAMIMNLYLGI